MQNHEETRKKTVRQMKCIYAALLHAKFPGSWLRKKRKSSKAHLTSWQHLRRSSSWCPLASHLSRSSKALAWHMLCLSTLKGIKEEPVGCVCYLVVPAKLWEGSAWRPLTIFDHCFADGLRFHQLEKCRAWVASSGPPTRRSSDVRSSPLTDDSCEVSHKVVKQVVSQVRL